MRSVDVGTETPDTVVTGKAFRRRECACRSEPRDTFHSEDQVMRVMVLVKATGDSEAGTMPTAELMEAMGKFNEELASAGVLLAGGGLKPSSQGKRVAFVGPNRTVTDGPFAAAGELVAGFWLWKVKNMEEAADWVKRCPNPMPGPSEIEIRPLYEQSDFED